MALKVIENVRHLGAAFCLCPLAAHSAFHGIPREFTPPQRGPEAREHGLSEIETFYDVMRRQGNRVLTERGRERNLRGPIAGPIAPEPS
jgi:hypothetical protein